MHKNYYFMCAGKKTRYFTSKCTILSARFNYFYLFQTPYEGPLRCTLKGYFLSYHPEADESILQSMELDTSAVSAHLEDLTPNTAYVIRLYAITDVEKSKYFVELTLRTSETSKHMDI